VVLQMSTFLICTVHLLFMTYNKLWAHISYSSADNRKITQAESLKEADLIFTCAQGHN
jgi:hypothetical protein